MRLGLPPLPAERSTNPRDVAGQEKPAPRATDMPTPDKVQEAGPKEEPKPEEPKPQEAKEEPKPEAEAPPKQAPPEPPPQQQALAQPDPPPPPAAGAGQARPAAAAAAVARAGPAAARRAAAARDRAGHPEAAAGARSGTATAQPQQAARPPPPARPRARQHRIAAPRSSSLGRPRSRPTAGAARGLGVAGRRAALARLPQSRRQLRPEARAGAVSLAGDAPDLRSFRYVAEERQHDPRGRHGADARDDLARRTAARRRSWRNRAVFPRSTPA